MAGGGGGGDGEPEFQIAPMIDVLLVLLIFFMTITTAQVMEVDKEITLPVSPNAKPRDPKVAKHEMPINLRWDQATQKSALVVDEKIYEDWSEIIPYLEQRKAQDDQLRIVIRGDHHLHASEVQKAMTLIGQAGISNIAFSASDK
jgi:biopolymer transport protein ExbD